MKKYHPVHIDKEKLTKSFDKFMKIWENLNFPGVHNEKLVKSILNTLNVYFLDHGKYFSFNAKEATEDIKMIETIQLRVKFKISMVP